MNSLIIGTAGHIDHGKSSLIRAMNGFEGDTLKEEQARKITIDLSFSSLSEGGKSVSFVDTPGHKDLIKTMISGAFAFSACLFVVDINEGFKEQSIEHLRILKLLEIEKIIWVFSKCDLCKDFVQEGKNLLKELKELDLKPLKVFYTSTLTGLGIDELKHYLLSLESKKTDEGLVFYYYIDRVFSLKGVGTVVTGSLNEGKISVGEKILCLDNQKELLVKNIQNHEKNYEEISAPNRVALNLNCNHKELQKGFLLSKKGFFKPFSQCDCWVRGGLKNEKMIFCVGTKQIECKSLILKELDKDQFFVHFTFEKKIFLSFDEKFILLQNNRLIGGGRVLNPLSEPLKKEQKNKLLSLLEKRDFKEAFEFLKDTHKHGFGLLSSYQRFKLSHEEALNLARGLEGVFVDEKKLNVYNLCVQDELKEFVFFILRKNPYAMLSAHFLALRMTWASEEFCEFVLRQMGDFLDFERGVYFKKGMSFEKLKEKNHNELYEVLKEQDIRPCSPYDIYDRLGLDRKSGDEILKKLTKNGLVVRLAHNLFIEKKALENLMQEFLKRLNTQNLDVQSVKRDFKLSRKYAIAYLEYLDKKETVAKKDEKRFLKTNDLD